jgi:molybdate transport system substrate-binding protein
MRRTPVLVMLLVTAILVGGCGGGGSGSGSGSRPQLVVSAAASLQTAFTQYGKVFPDANVRFSFAGSDTLAAQIIAGVRPDVYAAANTTLPDRLYAVNNLVGEPLRFASNELVLATRKGNTKIKSLKDIEKPGVKLAIGTSTVPVGNYTITTLAKLAPRDRKAIMANVRSQEPDVTGIVGKLTQGAVDAGFLYITDVHATNGALQAIHLPDALQPVVQYGITIVKGTKHPDQAKAFILGLLSGAGRDALDSQGFGLPPSGPA